MDQDNAKLSLGGESELLDGAIKRLDGIDYAMDVSITSFNNKGKSKFREFN